MMTENKYNGAVTGAEQMMFYVEQVRRLQDDGYYADAAGAMWSAQLAGKHLDYDARCAA